MAEYQPIYLPDTNAAYETWVQQHKHDGFVITAHRTSTDLMYWHRADCGHIAPDGATSFVEGDYSTIKACAVDPGALAVWAKQHDEKLAYCKDCRWKWEKEHGVTG